MSAFLGKRYKCEACGTEVLCTKNSEPGSAVECCGQEMNPQETRKLAQSD